MRVWPRPDVGALILGFYDRVIAVIDTDFCIFALNRIAMELSSILDSIPLAVQRQCPDISPHHVDFLKLPIAKGANCCANAGDKLPEWLDEYLSISAE